MRKNFPGTLATIADQSVSAADIAAIAKQREEMASYNAKLTSYLAKREAIRTSFNTATANAEEALESVRESAFTKAAGDAADKKYRNAIHSANDAYTTALKTLGASPVKPVTPEGTRNYPQDV